MSKAADYTPEEYERRKQYARIRSREASEKGRDIAPIPDCVNPKRKASCKHDFRLFCETYFADTFELGWSPDHLKVIARIEQCVLHGGLFALAMPRGSGKTTLAETAALWSLMYGHREFITLIGASETAATEILSSLKSSLENNDLLFDDFPEVCYPIRRIEGIAHRCAGQLCDGERTLITWTSDTLVLPTIKGSPASGTTVHVCGITGRIRGMKAKKANGKSIRPSLVIVDDPQTRDSASSPEQNRKRIATLAGDILGLSGPGKKISGIMPCTVIRPGDMADEILDNEKHPDWNGERMKMLYSYPERMDLWEKYADIRKESFRMYGDFRDATEFYRQNREDMDKGARVAWESRYNDDELSAIQHAMNLRLQDEPAFLAEYQNEPIVETLGTDDVMSAYEIAMKLSGIEQNVCPYDTTHVTMFIDVQKALLFYTIVAWKDDFTGEVLDYGTFPPQRTRIFTLEKANPTLQTTFKNQSLESQIYSGLTLLIKDKMTTEFKCDDGTVMHIERVAIDANWGQSTEIVYQFCRESEYSGFIIPSHGRYYGASSKPITSYKKKSGEHIGLNWMTSKGGESKRAVRHLIYDTNFWKSFVHARLELPCGERSTMTLYGRDPNIHELFSHHITAETRVRTSGMGRVVDEWKLRPEREDNHWFDCVVGCSVLASMLGCTLPEFSGLVQQKRNVIHIGKNNATQSVAEPDCSVPMKRERKVISLNQIQKQRNG